jgi:hypothetical protein
MAQRSSGAAAGGQLEEKIDFSTETTAQLARTRQSLQDGTGSLADALASLMALEKQCRVGNDNASLNRICQACVQYCYEAKDTTTLLATLQTLATRRSQKTSAIQTLVQTALPWCVQEPYTPVPVNTPEEAQARNSLVETLRDISNGKLFLERERAQLTRALATIKVCSNVFVSFGYCFVMVTYISCFWILKTDFAHYDGCIDTFLMIGTRGGHCQCRFDHSRSTR